MDDKFLENGSFFLLSLISDLEVICLFFLSIERTDYGWKFLRDKWWQLKIWMSPLLVFFLFRLIVDVIIILDKFCCENYSFHQHSLPFSTPPSTHFRLQWKTIKKIKSIINHVQYWHLFLSVVEEFHQSWFVQIHIHANLINSLHLIQMLLQNFIQPSVLFVEEMVTFFRIQHLS